MRPNRRFTGSTLCLVILIAVFAVAQAGPALAGKTKLLKDIRHGPLASEPSGLTRSSDMVFFTALQRNGRAALWRTKGRGYDTRGLADQVDYGLKNVEGLAVYKRWDLARSRCVYTSDGTLAGTGKFDCDIIKRVAFMDASNWDKLHGSWLYAGYRSKSNSLWRSDDGTVAGGVLVKQFPGGGYDPRLVQNVTKAGEFVFFVANDGSHGPELWRSDGTTAGTRMVKDIWTGAGSSKPDHLTAVGDRLFFAARTPQHGREVWVSDGTARGTRRVRDIRPGKYGSAPTELTRVGGKLMFAANDGKAGRELWKSDGTWTGTKRVKDIRPGKQSSGPRQLTALLGRLYFTANDGVHGPELWRSSGWRSSTKLVKDIRAGGKGSNPQQLTRVGARLVFTADHPRYGRELWLHKP